MLDIICAQCKSERHTDVSEATVIYPSHGYVITTRHDLKQGTNLQWIGPTFPSFVKTVIKLNSAVWQIDSRENDNYFLSDEISYLH